MLVSVATAEVLNIPFISVNASKKRELIWYGCLPNDWMLSREPPRRRPLQHRRHSRLWK